MAKLLLKAANTIPNVQVEIVPDKPEGVTHLQCWRMKPLWEDDVSLLLCRDVEYALSMYELKSVLFFEQSDKHYIHSIRGCAHHNGGFLAGLCGFKTQEVRKKTAISSFEQYVEYVRSVSSNWNYNIHQKALGVWAKSLDIDKHIMDCYFEDCLPNLSLFANADSYCYGTYSNIKCDINEDAAYLLTSMYHSDTRLIHKGQKRVLPPFIGRAWTCPDDSLRFLLQYAPIIVQTFIQNEHISERKY
jgi:hypothetical protein